MLLESGRESSIGCITLLRRLDELAGERYLVPSRTLAQFRTQDERLRALSGKVLSHLGAFVGEVRPCIVEPVFVQAEPPSEGEIWKESIDKSDE